MKRPGRPGRLDRAASPPRPAGLGLSARRTGRGRLGPTCPPRAARLRVPLACVSAFAAAAAGAHSASDAYLTLSVDTTGAMHRTVIHGQWDIALRDLDFVLKLDDDGNGQVTWGEFKRHQAAIERYAYEQLKFSDAPGHACSIKAARPMIDDHADGAYAALFFDVLCTDTPRSLTMNYSLFFAIDPSHRGIFIMHAGEDTSTAVLAPKNASIVLNIAAPK